MACGSALLILAALVGSCTQVTGAANAAKGQNDLSAGNSAKTEHALSPTSSVHALRPGDISALYTLGIPVSNKDEVSRVVGRVAELLSMFSPDLIAPHVHQGSVKPRSLLEEAEELSLSHQVTGWKLVLLFVPADSTCACSPNVAADVEAVVQDVEAALQMLQNRMRHTLVHVAVWSTHQEKEDRCQCLGGGSTKQRLYKAALLKTLQDSLSHALENPQWHSRSEAFSAVLQSVPAVPESNSDSDLSQTAVELWTNLLQPVTGQTQVASDVFTIPFPTPERPFLRTRMHSLADTEENLHSRASAPADPVMGTEVPCLDRSPSPDAPTSVHSLRPGDVAAVAAMGDSLTAGNGVGARKDHVLLVLTQYRGLSWSIGGDQNISTVTTLPNILRQFNPSLTGFSTGTGGENRPGAFLNQAVPGAKTRDMVKQARVLVDKMKSDSRIDFYSDWKVITLFIGGNDLCDLCTDTVYHSVRNAVGRVRQALDLLHSEVPRALVNLVEVFHMVPLRELHRDGSLGCPTWLVKMLCPCIVRPKDGSSELREVDGFNRGYQEAMRELVDSGRYDTHDNFTVVLQPFFRDISLPTLEDGRPDRSYFTPDCFHLSQKAHTIMARALWNNMLEPVGNKTSTQDFTAGVSLKCPSETHPFFRTALNSNYTYPGPPPTPAPVTNWGSDFSCANTAPSSSAPASAHRLRPADIQVVAALGDSVTAGYGARAKNLAQLSTEYRGVSWSIGGDDTLDTVTTLPNILKRFNPKIKGESKGRGKEQTGFNMAVSGAKVAQIPRQVRELIDTMKNDSAVDFQSDWKLVTLFIGGNDLCQYCSDRASLSPQKYRLHLQTSLDMLYEELPRTIVNVLEIMEIEGLRRIKRNSLGCNVIQEYICACFLSPRENSPELAEMKRINRDVQMETESLVYGGRYDGREDFAVVLQPFFRNTIVPLNADGDPDTTYFSEDCFHFSERGHADMAVALWNNMLEPVGEKQTYNNFTNARNNIKCPTEEHPYIFTKTNSCRRSSCQDKVPAWVAAVLAVVGLLIGWAVTWLFLTCRARRSKRSMNSALEMTKATSF